jgi:hypothetical protein
MGQTPTGMTETEQQHIFESWLDAHKALLFKVVRAYAFNEAALHKSIQSKKKRASRLSNINDFGLMGNAVITAITYSFISIINETPSLYDYLIPIILVGIGIYVLVGRIKRKKKELQFERTMLRDLDHTIASVSYEAKRAKTFVWWFILPLAILIFLNMSTAEVQALKAWQLRNGFRFT